MLQLVRKSTVYLEYTASYYFTHTYAVLSLSKNVCDRVTSTPDLSTNANALGFSTMTVTRSLANSTVTIRATNVAKASTVWNDVPSTRYSRYPDS